MIQRQDSRGWGIVQSRFLTGMSGMNRFCVDGRGVCFSGWGKMKNGIEGVEKAAQPAIRWEIVTSII